MDADLLYKTLKIWKLTTINATQIRKMDSPRGRQQNLIEILAFKWIIGKFGKSAGKMVFSTNCNGKKDNKDKDV